MCHFPSKQFRLFFLWKPFPWRQSSAWKIYMKVSFGKWIEIHENATKHFRGKCIFPFEFISIKAKVLPLTILFFRQYSKEKDLKAFCLHYSPLSLENVEAMKQKSGKRLIWKRQTYLRVGKLFTSNRVENVPGLRNMFIWNDKLRYEAASLLGDENKVWVLRFLCSNCNWEKSERSKISCLVSGMLAAVYNTKVHRQLLGKALRREFMITVEVENTTLAFALLSLLPCCFVCMKTVFYSSSLAMKSLVAWQHESDICESNCALFHSNHPSSHTLYVVFPRSYLVAFIKN